MRVKDFWNVVPLPAKIKLVWDRLTLTKTTTAYFVFSILHCVIQVVFQAHAFQYNVWAAGLLASITEKGNAVDSKSFYIFQNDLQLCNFVSPHSSAISCQVLWDGTVGSTAPAPSSSVANATVNASTGTERTFLDTIEADNNNGTVRVVLNDPGQNKDGAILDGECLLVLGWPVQVLRNTEREDLVFIMFQIWVLGMSIVAILNESIPHMIATLLTHLVATGWTGFQIFSTIRFRSDFAAVTTNGACHSVDLLQGYWQSRASDELSSLISNSVALLVSVLLCWRLAKSFGWQTFKRVGASPTISRTYRAVLTLSIVIQLSSFFILTSIALWLDQLWNGAIGHLAIWPLYREFLTATLILLPLWLAFGWYSVRREHKIMTFVFLALCCGYLAGWGAMFDSFTFRWTYMAWPFFAVMTTASVLLTLLAFILGIMCRINFGKGLPHYLKGHEPIEDGFEAVDPEKMVFPSSKGPTYAVSFGARLQFPPQVSIQNTAQPMQMNSHVPLQQPSRAVTRTPSERTYHSVHREPPNRFVSSSKTWI